MYMVLSPEEWFILSPSKTKLGAKKKTRKQEADEMSARTEAVWAARKAMAMQEADRILKKNAEFEAKQKLQEVADVE